MSEITVTVTNEEGEEIARNSVSAYRETADYLYRANQTAEDVGAVVPSPLREEHRAACQALQELASKARRVETRAERLAALPARPGASKVSLLEALDLAIKEEL